MQDIAFSVGAKYFSEKTGDDLSLIRPEDLGYADKIIVGKDNAIIIKNGEITKETMNRVTELRLQQETLTAKHERDFVNERIASLVGGIGCIYVGATSDIEQKEKFDRVDDSVCAVRSALQEGIIPGGGLPLYTIANDMLEVVGGNEQVAVNIMKDALTAPLKQILENAGKSADSIMHDDLVDNEGFDVKSEKYGDMFQMGIVDPLKVTRNALLNAVSVATTILSTNAIVTHLRDKS
jgi:chaperonin GroEL